MSVNNLCQSELQRDIDNCLKDPLIQGVEREAVIIQRNNYDETNTTFEAERPNVVTHLAKKAGTQGFKLIMKGAQPFNNSTTDAVAGAVQNSLNTQIQLVILGNDPDTCREILDPLMDSGNEFIVVVKNKYVNRNKSTTPADSKYQIHGLEVGLTMSAGTRPFYSETLGGWTITLTSTAHVKSGIFLYAGTEALSDDEFEALTQVD